MTNRETILSELRRIAVENGGTPPGVAAFEKMTGITQAQWRGKWWVRWSDLVVDAGLVPGRMTEAHSDEFLLGHLAALTLQLGRFPTSAEVRIQRMGDLSFPNSKTFDRLGDKAARIARLRAFVSDHPQYSVALPILGTAAPLSEAEPAGDPESLREGFVYMLKLGKHYKVGMTIDVPRRHRQIALELPEKPDVVHSIRTDDPEGIEAYWHRRFASKQTNGEWFSLDGKDIKAFKRRKFM